MNKENERVCVDYVDQSERYWFTTEDREKSLKKPQFFSLYRSRVEELKPRILKNAKKLLGKHLPELSLLTLGRKHRFIDVFAGENSKYTPLSELKVDKPALVIGVVVKKCVKRPSVFTEFKEPDCEDEEVLWALEKKEAAEEAKAEGVAECIESVCSVEDTLELEDDKQRIPLSGEDVDKVGSLTVFQLWLQFLGIFEKCSIDKVIFRMLS